MTHDPKATTPDVTGHLNDTPKNRKALATLQAEGTGTPMTNQAAFSTRVPVPTVEGDVYEFVRADFARTLERENAHLLTHLRKYDFLAVTHPHLYQGKP